MSSAFKSFGGLGRRERPRIHLFWGQGWDAAPEFAVRNARQWEALGTEVRRWDVESASAEFPFFARHQGSMSHHAMRADVLLAHAAHRYGGFVMGTDMRPLNPAPMFALATLVPAFLVSHDREVYNGGSYFEAGHPFLAAVIEELAAPRAVNRFGRTHVSQVTGPALWHQVLSRDGWNEPWRVVRVPAPIAFSHVQKGVPTPGAVDPWLDPGLHSSWYEEHLKGVAP